jgi:hypothetical protein
MVDEYEHVSADPARTVRVEQFDGFTQVALLRIHRRMA